MRPVPGESGERTRGARMPRTARRAQLLDSALDVFVAQGYHAAAMDDIAERAGVSKPVLYQHFPGKLDLYVALLDQACEQVVEGVRKALASTTDNKERVAATTQAFYAYVANAGGAFRLVFESDLTSEPAVRERVDRVISLCAEEIAEVIHDDTGFPPEASRLLAVALVGMSQVSARYWLQVDGDLAQEQATELISSLAWRGIRGFPRTE
ncbi:MAG: TetR/AcrR family transcriptional regulator [Nocardioidaceae bacterium]